MRGWPLEPSAGDPRTSGWPSEPSAGGPPMSGWHFPGSWQTIDREIARATGTIPDPPASDREFHNGPTGGSAPQPRVIARTLHAAARDSRDLAHKPRGLEDR